MAVYQIGPQAIKPTALGELARGIQAYQQNKMAVEQAQILNDLRKAETVYRLAHAGALGQPKPTKSLSPSQQLNKMKLDWLMSQPADIRSKIIEKILIKPPIQIGEGDPRKYASELRKEYQASPKYKSYLTIKSAEAKMRSALELSLDPNSESRVASDQALAVLFQKMLDPTSVVRESEYARTGEGVAMINRIISFIPKLQKGGLAISDADRTALYQMAEQFLKIAEAEMVAHTSQYAGLAKEYGVPESMVLPKKSSKKDVFTIGEIRTDPQGNQRKYIGKGKWQLKK